MFIGRQQELEFLNNKYNSKKAEFVVLYGRRRVGKTELLTEFCRDKPNLFYSCNEYTDRKQFSAFCNSLFVFEPSLHKQIRRFADWQDVFSSLGDLPGEEKKIIVIDEFPYMCKGDKSIPSLLQNLWDHKLKDSNIMLILSGSSVSFIEDELLGVKNPLYGRATGIYKLEPLPFDDAVKFFPDYSNEEKVTAFSILGGIPHYLKQFDPDISLEDNIKKHILSKGTVLSGEVEYILHQELREPAIYITLLETIATGSTKFNEICERSQIESGKMSVYLRNLAELGIIARDYPVLTKAKDLTKKNIGEYRITDDFFRFWFAYVYKYSSELALGNVDDLWNYVIKKDLHNFASKAFENISIKYLYKQRHIGNTPVLFLSIGRWWGKVTHKDENGKPYTVSEEIDVLATDKDEKNYIIGECKFTNEPFDLAQLKALQKKLEINGEKYWYLFSLNGFTDAVKDAAKENNNIRLVTLDDMLD